MAQDKLTADTEIQLSAPIRDPQTGHFLPGNPGNPAGRPRAENMRQAMQRYLNQGDRKEALVAVLFRISQDSAHREQRQAAEYLINQLAGAPRQVVKLSTDEANPLALLMLQIGQTFYGAGPQLPAVDAEVRELPAEC